MSADVFLFWFLAIITVASALTVVIIANPVYSALALAMTMVGVSAMFVNLDAIFVACVQLIVYAGAVMVLFVMVIMLFDLKHEVQVFSRGLISGLVKIGTVGLLSGLVVGSILMSLYPTVKGDFKTLSSVAVDRLSSAAQVTHDSTLSPSNDGVTRAIGHLIFTKYVFGFEALGVLLMIVAIGAVALSRSRGGTHAKH
jgi:NADH-quinone oxidoreductase subunit J